MDHVRVIWVEVLDFAEVLEQGEAKAVLALVADRKIRKDEIAGGRWAIKVGHASNWSTRQDWRAGDGGRTATRGERTGILETGVQEEVGVVGKGDVLVVLVDAQLDNRRRIHRTTVSARLSTAPASTGALGLLDHLQIVANATAILGGAVGCVLRLVGDWDH